LDRVTTGASSAKSRGYDYDANSNRTETTGTTTSTETVATTNNYLSSTSGGIVRTYGYDAAGNTTSFTGETFTFNQRGRMSVAVSSAGTTNYVYNAVGQLIEKSGNGGTTILVYDEAGHILGEYTSTGALIQETVWMGNTPVATIQPSGTSVAIYYIHTDQLNNPRKVTRPSDNGLMWRWDPDTFGSVAPNTNPSGLGTFTYNLRFPGMYSLPESALYYNYHRTYDPQMGRYVESDPIGLEGGINPYAYVGGNPISRMDPLGLSQAAQNPPPPAPPTPPTPVNPDRLMSEIAMVVALVSSWEESGPRPSIAETEGPIEFDLAALALSKSGGAAAEETTLLRGVASDSPAFENALNGTANPIGGNASMLEHSLGNTASEFTSWTSDPEVALQYATNRGQTSGVILTGTFPQGAATPAQAAIEAMMGESEYLVRGPISGASVQRVP
jgi:RHS repeat-associated protein